MRPKLIWILLAASLLLNLFFAGGVIYSKMTADRLRGGPDRRIDFVANELDLDAAERGQLSALREAAWQRRDAMRREGQHLHQELIDEMGKPTLDRARVEALLSERSRLFVTFVGDVMTDTHDFLNTLEPEKRRKFLDLMDREHRFLWRLLRDPDRERQPPP